MQVLLAVVEDLYLFAVTTFFPWARRHHEIEAPLYLPPSKVVSAAPEMMEIETYRDEMPEEWLSEAAPPTEHEIENEMEIETDMPAEAAQSPAASAVHADEELFPQKHTIAYCAERQAPLRSAPDTASDTVIATVAYGDMLMVLGARDGYTYVAAGDKRGYIPTSALAEKAAGVYPAFTVGERNGPHDQNTVRLRSFIRDEFSAGLSQLSLQAHEYVYYRLLRRGVQIAWPDIRPRTAGSWARILGDLTNVTVGEEPVVGAVIEYASHDDPAEKARLGYVEKVFPDKGIQISEADWPAEGVYNERTFSEDEWRALDPAFISIS
jgi:hypothetical protein